MTRTLRLAEAGASPVRELDAIVADHKGESRDEILSAWRSHLDQYEEQVNALLEDRLTRLARELGMALAAERDSAVAEARESAKCEMSGELNQAVRRLRGAGSAEEVTAWLLDSSAAFCGPAAVLAIHGDHLQGLRLRGIEDETARARFDVLEAQLEDAPAVAQCVGGGDSVVAIATAKEVSPALMEIFQHAPGEKVHLFPLVVRGETGAVLYTTAGETPVDTPGLELLAEISSLAVEALISAPEPAAVEERAEAAAVGLVNISGITLTPPPPRSQPEWPALSGEEQELHLKARRFARVHVSEMRLYHSKEVQAGRAKRNLYGMLRDPIDTARETFYQRFVMVCESMTDYLHMELVRTLAHDNAVLMGREYPGPLV